MATYTSHYNLKKPAGTENININDINDNMDKIANALWALPATYKGTLAAGTDLDDMRYDSDKGIYQIGNDVPLNAPTSTCYWGILFVIRAGLSQQWIVKPVSGKIWMREYSGNPSQWQPWKEFIANNVGSTTVTEITYGSNSHVWYWRSGSVVTVTIQYAVSDGSIEAWSTKQIATLPSGFRPPRSVVACGIIDRVGDPGAYASIGSDGKVFVGARHTAFATGGDILQATVAFAVA